MLDGVFSFVLLDTKDKSFIAARDAIGVMPLYLGWGHDGIIYSATYLCINIRITWLYHSMHLML